MNSKLTYRQYLWIALIPLLMGCGFGATTIRPTEVDVNAISTQAVMTVIAQMTQTAAPTETPAPTQTLTPAPTLTPLPFVKLDGLRMFYVIDGNVYVQDSGGQPVQLTHSGHDRSPRFSDDGEKIVFFRGAVEEQYRLYAINADGSQEQALITGSILAALGLGYDESTEIDFRYFIPGTHQLLFDTQQFKPNSGNGFYSYHPNARGNADLLIVNVDTAEIKQLKGHKKGGIGLISPDGKLMTDNINLFRTNGDLVRSNLITYLPAWENEGIGLSWTQDSRTVIILPPIDGNADPTDGPEPRTIWQYPIDGSPAVEIRLNPPPMDVFDVSPDGNWIAYSYYYYPGKTDETSTNGVYIGNLRDGSSHLVGSGQSYELPYSFDWSPDSKYFIFGNDGETVHLGNTDGDIDSLDGTEFIGWMDGNHYLYKKDGVVMRDVSAERSVLVLDLPEDLKKLNLINFSFSFVYVIPK